MGAGAALEARDRYPEIAFLVGNAIKNTPDFYTAKASLFIYGFIIVPLFNLGLFQVKLDWYDLARVDVIKMSTHQLKKYADLNPDITIAMNYPGIGKGQLPRETVASIINVLPDNVTVCQKEE